MKILNFGSINIDYIYKVDHFVLPGETISSDELSITTGGKGLNQSIAISRAGAEVFHAGMVGVNDLEILKDFLNENSIYNDYIEAGESGSGHAIIQLDKNGQNSIILYGGANKNIENSFVDRVLDDFDKGDILVLQNEISVVPYIIESASKKGMRIFFNPSPANERLKEYPIHLINTLILNEIEGEQLTDKCKIEEMLNALIHKYPDMEIVLTLGKRGVIYSGKGIGEYHGVYETDVVDTTAAGDTFTGYFIAAQSRGEDIKKSLELASAAASIAVSKLGAACSIPLLKEVETFLLNYTKPI